MLDQSEYDEQIEFAQQVRTLLDQLPVHSAQSSLSSQTEQLVALIQDKRPGPEVSALAHQLRWHIIHAYNVAVAPKRPPDLRWRQNSTRPNALLVTGSRVRAMGQPALILTPHQATSTIGSAWISAVSTACIAPLPGCPGHGDGELPHAERGRALGPRSTSVLSQMT